MNDPLIDQLITGIALLVLGVIYAISAARDRARRGRIRAARSAAVTALNSHWDAMCAASEKPSSAQVIGGRLVRPADGELAELLRSTRRQGEQN